MYDVSVSIITYKRKELLAEVINSFEEQTYPKEKFEIVVVDDGSCDGTDLVMQEIIKRSSCNIRYIKEEKNQGKAIVRNISIKGSSGDIILFLEDDTIADKNLLEEHVKSHRSANRTNLAVLGCQVRTTESVKTPFGRYIIKSSRGFFDNIKERIKTRDPEAFRGFITFNLSVKRSFLEENGLFDPKFKYFCEDIELGYRLSGKGLSMGYNDNAKIFDYHPPYFDEYCRRNVNRGYYRFKLHKKYAELGVCHVSEGIKYLFKRIVYPVCGIIVNVLDRIFKIPFSFSIYQRILDYYLEKGIKKAMSGKNI